MKEIKNQHCPFCNKDTMSLIEEEKDIPYFGKCYLMSMRCDSCSYYKSDIESIDKKDPIKYTFTFSEYFPSNSPIAPNFLASSKDNISK